MNRRGYSTSIGLIGAAALAGCLGTDGGGDRPAVEGSDATLAPGETASVTVRAETVDRLSFGVSFLDSEDLTVESFEVAPAPDSTRERYPPEWLWDDPQSNVEATMELRADDDAATATVSYSVTAALGDEEVTREFDVAVQSRSD